MGADIVSFKEKDICTKHSNFVLDF